MKSYGAQCAAQNYFPGGAAALAPTLPAARVDAIVMPFLYGLLIKYSQAAAAADDRRPVVHV